MSATLEMPLGDRLPADHPPIHEGPIDGPGVWYGPQLARSDDWTYALSAAERSELLEATRASAAMTIGAITRADFPLPGLGPVLDALRHEIVHGRGFVLLRGLPIEGLDFATVARMYWGLGRYFGRARSQNTRGHLLGHITDISDRYADGSDRGYLTARHLAYHCDSVDVVSLLCLQQAKHGGDSSIVSSYTLHDELWRRRPDLARVLYEPFARDRRDEIPEGRGPWYELPVFNYYRGRLAVSYLRRHIDTSQRHPDARRLSARMIEALDALFELANSPELHLTMQFQPGDMQLLHNHQILHDRTAYEDWEEIERRRYLLRLWLSPPDGIALPEAFAGRYGTVTPGERGGVSVPGMVETVPLTAF